MRLGPPERGAEDDRKIACLLSEGFSLLDRAGETSGPAGKDALRRELRVILRRLEETPLGLPMQLNRALLAFNAAVAAFLDWDITLSAAFVRLKGLEWADREQDPKRRGHFRRIMVLNMLTVEALPPAPDTGWAPRELSGSGAPGPSPIRLDPEYVVATGLDDPEARRKAFAGRAGDILRESHPSWGA
jgi:hypothetical protein